MPTPQFPLRLSAFEEYFVIHDRKDSPSTIWFQFELNQSLEKKLAQEILNEVASRNPLAKCRLGYDSKARPQWELTDKTPTFVWAETALTQDAYPHAWLDLEQGPPIQAFAYPTPQGGTTLLFLTHHVAMDGLGFMRFFQEWLNLYRRATATNIKQAISESPSPYDAKLLSRRCRPIQTWPEKLKLFPGQWHSLKAAFKIFNQQVIPIVPLPQHDDHNPRRPTFVRKSLTAQETKQLRTTATQLGTTSNTILLRDIYIAMDQWKSDNKISTSGTHYRVSVPKNERTDSANKLSACNHCTILNIDQTPDDIQNPAEMMSHLDGYMRAVKKWRLSLNFWRFIELFRFLPGGLAKFVGQRSEVTATTLFTNLGNLSKFFNLDDNTQSNIRVEDILVIATLSQNMPIAISLSFVNSQLNVVMQFDPRSIQREQAHQLLDCYFDQLRSSIGNRQAA